MLPYAPGSGVAQEEIATRWVQRLQTVGTVGLLRDLAAVLARVLGCRLDLAAHSPHQPEEHSVLWRCLALLGLLVSELPPAGEANATINDMLRKHVAAAVLDHLRSIPDAASVHDASTTGAVHRMGCPGIVGVELIAAQANLGRMLHRCIAGSLRSYVTEGLKAAVPQSAQARHATNALAWMRSVLHHPAMRQQGLLERWDTAPWTDVAH